MSYGAGEYAKRRSFAGPAAPEIEYDPTDRVAVGSLTAILFSCIFLQRLAVPFGTMQLSLSFLVGLAAVGYLLLRGRFTLHVELGVFFFIVMACLTFSILRSASASSLMSFFYLFVIYVLYVVKLRFRSEEGEEVQGIFLNFMTFAAACGIGQFCLQFVLPQELIFPLETFVPGPFLFGDLYNVIIPLTYGSPIVKSNGVFFLEPSFFSQFLAIALILELLREQRAMRLALYAAAMVVSYSGTGLILVALFMPYIFMRRGNISLLVLVMVVAAIVVFAGSMLNLDTMTNRVGEFSSTESSGFARFVSPFLLFRDFLADSPGDMLFGMGPGTITEVIGRASYKGYIAHDPTWIKAILEYGVVPGLLLIGYVVTALLHGTSNKIFAVALLMLYLFVGGYLLNPIIHFLFVALAVWSNAPPTENQWALRSLRLRLRR